MRRLVGGAFLAAILGMSAPASAETLVINSWGGPFPDLVRKTMAEKFKAETGADVEFVTGGTIDRLNRAKLAKANPESDITFTTAHVGWLYVSDDLFEKLDLSKVPNAKNLISLAKISDYHIGTFGYVYTIAYRPDLAPKGVTFESWNDLWNPALKGKIAAPDFDPSHIINVAALLSGGSAADWQKGEKKLLELKPNFKAFYTNDANSIQLMSSGETAVQVILSMNGYHMIHQGVPIKIVVPKEGAVLGIDTIAITKGSKKQELAYKFINAAFDPEVQGMLTKIQMASPMVTNAKVDPELAKLPAVFTTEEQWKHVFVIDHKIRAEKTAEWRKWFAENMIAK